MKRANHRTRSRAELRFESLESRQLLAADVLISEIMYHTATNDSSHEFIELHNRGDAQADLSGWKITNGVEFSFPDTSLPANGYIAIAADVDAFEAAYNADVQVVGGWTGRLANRGETITIVDKDGVEVDRVRYADQGEWGTRKLDKIDAGFQGWTWDAPHDGKGRSLELINPNLPNELGQNWSASTGDGGTPGRANSAASMNTAPIATNVRHLPVIPNSAEPVTAYVDITDSNEHITPTLYYRPNATGFTPLTMTPVESPDTTPGTTTYAATIHAVPDGTVMEFFIEATDDDGNSRRTPNAVEHPIRTANFLYQVIDDAPDTDTWTPNDQPISYLIMREPERALLADIGDGPLVEAESNASMNATFIRVDGNGTDVRYNVSVRNRGGSSRVGPPNNYRINFPHDRPWDGAVSLNLNSRFVHAQIIGSAIYRLAGLAAAEATPIQVRVNGNDLAEPGGPLMFGTYAQLENITGSFPDRHFSNDRRGNLYRAVAVGTESADLSYLGPDPEAYQTVYSKRTNEEQDDWSDLIQLTLALNETPDDQFVDRLGEVIDIDQWLRYIALDSLLGNRETGLALGAGDNYWLYRGEVDTRFKIIPHDLDTILGRARVGEPNRSIFAYTAVPGLSRLLTHPETVPRYYQAFLDLIDEVYNPQTLNPLFDRVLGDFVPSDELDEMKQFVLDRIAGVLDQLPREFTINSDLPQVNGVHRTTLPAAELIGTADALRTDRIEVNGQPTEWSPFTREWSIQTTSEGKARSLIDFGADWKYLDDGSNQSATWRQVEVDDTEWKSGPAPLGYGNGNEATVIGFGPNPNNKHITTYLRHSFNIADHEQIRDLTLRLQRDDGAIVYLNGEEIARSNMPNREIDYQTVASTWIGGGLEQQIESFSIDPRHLQNGKNVLAVEVHQRSAIDDDIRLDLSLEATVGAIEGGVRLLPGVNRIDVAAYEASATTPFERGAIDIWYDGAIGKDTATCESFKNHGQLAMATIGAGSLAENTVLAPCGPAYRVTGQVIVPSGTTLTIMPGTTLFFENDAGILVEGGRLVARGTRYEPIRMTRSPASNGSWNGVQFRNAMTDNHLSHTILEFAASASGMIGLESSELAVDSVTFEDTDRYRIRTVNSSLIVENSTFGDIFAEDQPPTTDNRSEHIWGSGIPAGGHFIIQDNYFGTTKGHNDAIDFGGAALPGPIPLIADNYFAGSGDDGVDLETDAIIVGNTFVNIVKDEFNSSTGDANAISAGDGRQYFVSRNIFANVDHAVQVKDDAFLTFENNTVSETNISAIYFDLDDRSPGKGAIITDSIFDKTSVTLGSPGQAESVEVHNSIVSDSAIDFGEGNLAGNPRFASGPSNFTLREGSPAIRSGTLGIDRGAKVDGSLVINGLPEHVASVRNLSLRFFGPGLNAYRYRIDDADWSEPLNMQSTLMLQNLDIGEHRIEVIGRDHAGQWQDESMISSATWTISETNESGLRINEVLAKNESALDVDGDYPDAVELFNSGTATVDLSGMSLTDDLSDPERFVFPSGTSIAPRGYLVVTEQTGELGLNFGLSADGEAVFLLDSNEQLVDSVEFGVQAADYSIGRTGRDAIWTLTRPTFGGPNEIQRTGDIESLRINEWFASSVIRFNDDFVELHNSDTLPVDLSGLMIADGIGPRHEQHSLPALSFIGPENFAVFYADGNVDGGPNHLPFRFNEVGESIAVRSSTGTLLDYVLFYEQTTDWSEGRSPDGTGLVTPQKIATPGRQNIVTNTVDATPIDWNHTWSFEEDSTNVPAHWLDPDFDDSGWQTGSGVFSVGASDLPIETQTALSGGNLTSYFRSEFEVGPEFFASEAVNSFEVFLLVDDGAAVYVNGVEAFRVGLPDGELTPTTRSNRGVSNAIVEGPFSIPESMLRVGMNEIAVQLHQISPASTDAVFGLSLSANSTFIESETIRATELLDGLRISELMYNPAGDDAAEFIELTNISDRTLDLAGVRLRGGIEFTFGESSLIPGERVVVVRNRVEFEKAYGTAIRIAGEFTGGLSNRTDRIRVLLPDPFDGAIADFTYQDDWYVETDGDGTSLVVRDEHDAPRHLQDKSGWRPSFQIGGSPGQAAPNVSPDFTQDGTTDIHDVNAICSRIRTRSQDLIFDLTGDNFLDGQDLNFMIESVFRTRVGDVDLDGRFDSRDLVTIFQAAQYDDGIPVNSTWSTGDWNCDGEFDSSDLVVAFQAGGYSAASQNNRAAIAAAIVFSDDE